MEVHPEEGIAAHVVGIDHEGAAGIQGGGPGPGLGVSVDHLHPFSVEGGLAGQLHIHPGAVGLAVGVSQLFRPGAVALIADGGARQIGGGDGDDIAHEGVAQVIVRQSLRPGAAGGGSAEQVGVMEPGELFGAPQVFIQAALQKLPGKPGAQDGPITGNQSG